MSRAFSIYGDREYFPCGCSYIVDRKTGETVQPSPCAKHRLFSLADPSFQ